MAPCPSCLSCRNGSCMGVCPLLCFSPLQCFLLPLTLPNAPHITHQQCSQVSVLLHTSAGVLALSPTARDSPRAAGELSVTSSSRCCPWLPCTSQFSLARSDRARWVTALMHREREQPDTTPRGGTGVQIPPFCPVCTRSCLRGSWGHIDGEEESSGYRALLVRSFSRSDISLFLTQSTNTFPRRDRRKPGGGLGCSSASHTHAGQGSAGSLACTGRCSTAVPSHPLSFLVLPCRPEPGGDNPCLHGQAGGRDLSAAGGRGAGAGRGGR